MPVELKRKPSARCSTESAQNAADFIEHAVVMAEDGTVHAEHLPESVLRPSEPMPIESARAMKEQFAEVERKNVEAALAAETGNQTRAAKRLGITRRMLIYKMAKFGLKRGNN